MSNESPDRMEMLNQLLDERMDMMAERVADIVYQRMCETTPKSGQEWFDPNTVGKAFGKRGVTVRNHWIRRCPKTGICRGGLEAKKVRGGGLLVHRNAIQDYMNKTGKSLVHPEVLA